VYQAAILRQAAKPQLAASFVQFITGSEVAKRFAEAGFGRY
jgi:ABC-type molybdate transport system substrate-binding protein